MKLRKKWPLVGRVLGAPLPRSATDIYKRQKKLLVLQKFRRKSYVRKI